MQILVFSESQCLDLIDLQILVVCESQCLDNCENCSLLVHNKNSLGRILEYFVSTGIIHHFCQDFDVIEINKYSRLWKIAICTPREESEQFPPAMWVWCPTRSGGHQTHKGGNYAFLQRCTYDFFYYLIFKMRFNYLKWKKYLSIFANI